MWTVGEDEQQEIQQEIEGLSSEVGGAVGGDDADDTIYLREDLAVEYSRSRRAKCVRCGINIEKVRERESFSINNALITGCSSYI